MKYKHPQKIKKPSKAGNLKFLHKQSQESLVQVLRLESPYRINALEQAKKTLRFTWKPKYKRSGYTF
ncbi:hypothetical protein PRUPE_8G233600 [Prunus persica]|uniref:Uncharacterized protein n=1 Tax=Prunus persica TaxID=3760 RepID=M5VP27_PRUPE|nr:hypothetical protein PRUPE_8G233600 [Prunus persica]